MWWVAGWALVTAVGVAGMLASLNSVRFGRRVAREVREMAALRPASPPSLASPQSPGLPPPVQRYLTKALAGQSRAVRSVHLRHGGVFRPSLSGAWLPIRGEQFFSADPPAFVWWGRVRMAPGIWIEARDRSVDGVGNMLVMMESTVTIANSSGPELDQGALLRLLGEMAWFPTAFLDDRYVRWSAIDDRRARATLQVNGRSVSGDFVFGADDLPAAFAAERYRDVGAGRSVLTPFVGRISDFRRVDGMLAPHRVVGAWIVDGQEMEYASFEVQELEYEWSGPGARPR